MTADELIAKLVEALRETSENLGDYVYANPWPPKKQPGKLIAIMERAQEALAAAEAYAKADVQRLTGWEFEALWRGQWERSEETYDSAETAAYHAARLRGYDPYPRTRIVRVDETRTVITRDAPKPANPTTQHAQGCPRLYGSDCSCGAAKGGE